MRETFTQNRKSLLVMISMLFLAVIGGKAYAEVADNEGPAPWGAGSF